MARPQSPELRRSGTTPALEPDNIGTRLEAEPRPGISGRGGPVPEDNRPGHHPAQEQDKPDPEAFVERFRTVPADDSADAETAEAPGSPLHHAKRLVGIGGGLAAAVAAVALRRMRKRS